MSEDSQGQSGADDVIAPEDEIQVRIADVPEPSPVSIMNELMAQAQEGQERAAAELRATAEQIRQEAEATADPDMEFNAERVATDLEQVAAYLDTRGLEQIGEDIARSVRHYAWLVAALTSFAGLVVGWLLGRDESE